MAYAKKVGSAEDQRILGLFNAGRTADEIGAALSVNAATVRSALRRLGVQMPRGPRVDAERVMKMFEMCAAGFPTSAISKAVGVPRATVKTTLYRGGAKRPRVAVSEATLQQVLPLYEDGHSATLIAKTLGVHPNSVLTAIRKAGIRPRRSGYRKMVSKEQKQEMASAYAAGASTTQIAGQLGVEAGTVQRYLRAAGVLLRPKGFQQGEEHHNWKGGRIITEDGYVLVLLRPDDSFYPMAQIKTSDARYCLEHRLVMAKHLGRLLTEEETVHHKDDSDRSNNHISNLQLRRGNHGKGAALKCAVCGSHNIVADELAPQKAN